MEQTKSIKEREAEIMEEMRAQFGCGNSPVHYFIQYCNGAAHWSTYREGWQISYVNSEQGKPQKCGEDIQATLLGICRKCKESKATELQSAFDKFDKEFKENYKKEIDQTIAFGRTIGITTIRYV